MGIWDSARHYAKAGIYVNPVYVKRKPDGKKDVRPVGLWRQTSSISLADIGAWEQDHPDAQLLIDCGKSKLLVVDCDGQEGVANWLALNPPPPLSVVSTPGGGQHWYYREHPDHPIGNDQDGKVAPSVDIRGIGGFVFAPPSSDGQGTWAWTIEPDWTAEGFHVPDVVIERMRKPSGGMTARESAPSAPGSQDKLDDPLFDPSADRLFTDEQATAFIAEARRKLEATRQGFNGAINTFAMVCAHFPWLVDRARCGRLVIRSLGKRTGWTEPDADDIRTIDSAYTATEAGRSWVATRIELSEAGQQEAEGRLRIGSAADMAYWLRENAGRGRMSGFFLRSGQVVHTPRIGEAGYIEPPAGGENGPAEIRPVTGPILAAKIQYLYDCYKAVDVKDDAGKKTGGKTDVAAMFPGQAAAVAVDAAESLGGLRVLRGLTHTPMVRADGSLLAGAGYDTASGYLHLPGVVVPEVPDVPTERDVEAARGLLLEMICDFPFSTPDDRANYLGLLLTPLLRQVTPPPYKAWGIGAHQPGSGKTLLAEVAGIIHEMVLRAETPEDEAEWRKESMAILGTTSAPLIVLDNVVGILRSGVLAGLLTAGKEITNRELGSNSKNITVANDRIWVLTGNNLSLGGDLVRRTITVLIDPDTPDPQGRTGFVIPDLKAWVTAHRGEILAALLTLIRAWVVAGMPGGGRKQSDSYAAWENAVAGILAVAGIGGEFDAASGERAAGGGDDDELTGVLTYLRDRFGEAEWAVRDAFKARDASLFTDDQRDWMPSVVLDRLSRSESAGRKSMGRYLLNRAGRWVTDSDGRALVVRKERVVDGVQVWRVHVR